ncbi:MAG: hypothetical protein F4Y02_15430 [Chloroflexi bacterium]|nr:hypothetical protein [Chloroflexota bacterium]
MNAFKNRWLWIILFAGICVPGSVSAQSICEGLTDILTMSRDQLEFYTVPGAICRASGRTFRCIWQKPEPGGHGKVLRQWLQTTIYPDMKKLAGAIQQCIQQDAIPYEWRSFKKRRSSGGWLRSYFVQRKAGERPRTISVCFEYDDRDVGAGVVLSVGNAPKGKSYCRW